jgi:hypothetical protein
MSSMNWVPVSLYPGLESDIDAYAEQRDRVSTAYGSFLVIRQDIVKQRTLQAAALTTLLATTYTEIGYLMTHGLPTVEGIFKTTIFADQFVNSDFVERRPALLRTLAALVSAFQQAHQRLQELWADKGLIQNPRQRLQWLSFSAAVAALPVVHAPPVPEPRRQPRRPKTPPLVPIVIVDDSPPRSPTHGAKTKPPVPAPRPGATRSVSPPRHPKQSGKTKSLKSKHLPLSLLLHQLSLLQ